MRNFSNLWMKFFTDTRMDSPSYYRGMKQITDYSQLVNYLHVILRQEVLHSGYLTLCDRDLMKAASIYKELRNHFKKYPQDSKEVKFLFELFEIIIFRVEKGGNFEWTPLTIANFFRFINDNPHIIVNLKPEIFENVFNISLSSYKDFKIADFAAMVFIFADHFPEKHSEYKNKFLELLRFEKKIECLDIKSLVSLIKGLFSIPKNKNYLKLNSQNELLLFDYEEKFMKELQREIVNKINLENINNIEAFEIASSLKNAQKEYRDKILQAIALKVLDFMRNDIELEENPDSLNMILNFSNAFLYYDVNESSKELFSSFMTRVFLKFFIRSQSRLQSLDEEFKIGFINIYLRLCEKFEYFQVVFLDKIVNILNDEVMNKYFRSHPYELSSIINSMAFLNYPGRFSIKIPHKPAQWSAWQNLLGKIEDFILASSHSSYSQSPTEVNQNSVKNINFLWSLCVFDIYSKPIIQLLANSIDPEEEITQTEYKKLYQIFYWLSIENFGEFSLDPQIIEKMKNFKSQWDQEASAITHDSDMKKIVKTTLEVDNYDFRENVRDFPYFFDFSHKTQKNAILIDDDDQFLEGTQLQIRSGFLKIMNRQVASLGWSVKKISIKNWLNISNNDILPR